MSNPKKLHVVFFPWTAFGHMIPFLELANQFAIRGHKITFISTPRNIQRLLKNSSKPTSPLIEFLNLNLPTDSSLPPNAEATSDLEFHQVPLLKKAIDALQEELSSFLNSSKPDWILYDFNAHWLPSIAKAAGISCGFYNIISSWTVCMFGSSPQSLINGTDRRKYEDYISPPSWVPFESNLSYRPYEAKHMFKGIGDDVSGVTDGYRLGNVLLGSDVLISRSCNELDGEWLSLLGDLHKKPVFAAGLLPPMEEGTKDDASEWSEIKRWLDKWEKGSVVYIALGSEAPLTQEVVNEFAYGVELCGFPFLWSYKVPKGSISLVEGYVERTSGRGLVWSGWVPQVSVLAHEAVGCFFTHCGWGSLVEGIAFGKPLVMLPCFLDQGLNARFFEGKKVGVEVVRNEDSGLFTKEGIVDALKKVMTNNKDNAYLENARRMQLVFGDKKLHKKYIDDLLVVLQEWRK